MLNTQAYLDALSQVPPVDDIEFGYRTVQVYDPDELEEAQLGYRVDPEGRDLTGTNEGDWRPEWLVIAYEDELGDPLFADTSAPGLPVYTATHGEGDWTPELVADTFEGFVAALSEVASAPDDPLSTRQRHALVKRIRKINPTASLDWWEAWLTNMDE